MALAMHDAGAAAGDQGRAGQEPRHARRAAAQHAVLTDCDLCGLCAAQHAVLAMLAYSVRVGVPVRAMQLYLSIT